MKQTDTEYTHRDENRTVKEFLLNSKILWLNSTHDFLNFIYQPIR